MSDQNPSDVAPQADAVTSSVPAAPVAPDGFGASRGTGLARGKRPARPTQTATGSEPVSGYQPTSIQIVVAPTTYQNPFDAELAPAPEPAAPAPVAESVVATAPVSAPVNSVPPVFAPVAFVVPAVVSTPAPASEAPSTFVEPAAKAELNILPPAAPRPATSWEATGSANTAAPAPAPRKITATGEDRTIFKIERKPVVTREITPLDPSVQQANRGEQPRGDRPRRDDRRRDEGRRNDQPAKPRVSAYPYNGDRTPAAAKPAGAAPSTAPKSVGFVGWLKGIFGGSSPESTAPSAAKPSERSERPGQGQGQGQGDPRRRRRGGRGRSGGPGAGPDNRAPRPEGQNQPQQGQRRREGGPGGDRGQGRAPRPPSAG
jgi:translation initiation factor IF-2